MRRRLLDSRCAGPPRQLPSPPSYSDAVRIADRSREAIRRAHSDYDPSRPPTPPGHLSAARLQAISEEKTISWADESPPTPRSASPEGETQDDRVNRLLGELRLTAARRKESSSVDADSHAPPSPPPQPASTSTTVTTTTAQLTPPESAPVFCCRQSKLADAWTNDLCVLFCAADRKLASLVTLFKSFGWDVRLRRNHDERRSLISAINTYRTTKYTALVLRSAGAFTQEQLLSICGCMNEVEEKLQFLDLNHLVVAEDEPAAWARYDPPHLRDPLIFGQNIWDAQD